MIIKYKSGIVKLKLKEFQSVSTFDATDIMIDIDKNFVTFCYKNTEHLYTNIDKIEFRICEAKGKEIIEDKKIYMD